MSEIIFNVKWGKFIFTAADLNELLNEAICESDDLTSYNEVYDSECSLDVFPKSFEEIAGLAIKHKWEYKISDAENRDEAMDTIYEILQDDLFEYTTQKEIAPDWVERIRENKASNHYNPCASCGGEDCGCCDYGRGY